MVSQDAYGNALASTADGVPSGGMAYRWIGGQGVRWDEATGLYYMRARGGTIRRLAGLCHRTLSTIGCSAQTHRTIATHMRMLNVNPSLPLTLPV